MTKSKKLTEYQNLKIQRDKFFSELNSVSKEKFVKDDKKNMISLDTALSSVRNELKKSIEIAKKIDVVSKKMEQIKSSLTKDEKNQFKKLGLSNEDNSN